MGKVPYLVTDGQGNPLPSVHIHQETNPGTCTSSPVDGYTDSSGKVTLDNGCPFQATGTWSAQLPGYESKSGTWGVGPLGGLTSSGTVQVSMPAVATSGGSCPLGYVEDPTTGQCIQQTQPNLLANVGQIIQDNWLLITVLVLVVALVAAMLWRPKSFASAVGAVRGAGGAAQ